MGVKAIDIQKDTEKVRNQKRVNSKVKEKSNKKGQWYSIM